MQHDEIEDLAKLKEYAAILATGDKTIIAWWEEPSPKWAIRKAVPNKIEIGLQLFTKNGRRCGNGYIHAVGGSVYEQGYYGWYYVITDIGNSMKLNENELHELFELGDYIMNVDEAYERRIKKEYDY